MNSELEKLHELRSIQKQMEEIKSTNVVDYSKYNALIKDKFSNTLYLLDGVCNGDNSMTIFSNDAYNSRLNELISILTEFESDMITKQYNTEVYNSLAVKETKIKQELGIK